MDTIMTDAIEENGENRAMDKEIDYIQPVALLMDELKNEESSVRIESVKRLGTIAMALGPERTRLELLPFLETSLDEEDEVLATLADEVITLLDSIGGMEHCHLLLPLLEGLAGTEEPFVRSKATMAFETIIEVMSEEQIIHSLFPLVQRLSIGDWFSKKCSAAVLIRLTMSRLYKTFSDEQRKLSMRDDLLKMLSSLSLEDMPLIRKSVASNVTALILILDVEPLARSILPLISQLASDPQDSVRCLSVEPLAVLLSRKEIIDEATAAQLVALFLSLVTDHSWRIRLVVASFFGKFSILAATNPRNIDFVEMFSALLRDPESEVRAAAASQLGAVATSFSSQNAFIESAKVLVSDGSPHVRAALASQLNELARIVGKDSASSSILPLIVQLLKDDSSDVRLNVISKLEVILGVVGIEELSSSLIPAIITLVEDKKWRVRQTIIEYIPDLAQTLGKEFFERHFKKLCVSWLEDPVFAVRETAVDTLKRIVRHFGSDWFSGSGVLQEVISLSSRRNYLYRETLLLFLSTTCSIIDIHALTASYIPVLERLTYDPIANVRLNVAKSLETIIPVLIATNQSDLIRSPVLPILQQLERDADVDVRDHAERALHVVPT